MTQAIAKKRKQRIRRHRRVRKKVQGTAERPRLTVFRSSKHIYCQVIDDVRGATLCSACTVSPELKDSARKTATVDAAKAVGRLVAQKAIQLGVKRLVFDRGGFRYHGRVAAVAEGAREIFKEAGEAGF
jgi:large subunit ribosomal protein L18